MLLSTTKDLLDNALKGGKEGFTNNTTNVISILLIVIIWLLLLLFVSKYIWNEVLVKLVTVVKPATSFVQLFALFILLEIMLPK
jgi:hypothetical protein